MFELILKDLLAFLHTTPGQAIAIKIVVDMVKSALKKLDATKLVDQHKVIVHTLTIVFTALGTFCALAGQHEAERFDAVPVLTYLIGLYFATTGVHQTVQNIKSTRLAHKISARLKAFKV